MRCVNSSAVSVTLTRYCFTLETPSKLSFILSIVDCFEIVMFTVFAVNREYLNMLPAVTVWVGLGEEKNVHLCIGIT